MKKLMDYLRYGRYGHDLIADALLMLFVAGVSTVIAYVLLSFLA